ncbi:MAG: isochorismatase family cysteine hydrolase [Pseudomonadota bacterium]
MSMLNRIQDRGNALFMAQLLKRYRSSDTKKTALVLLDTKPTSLATQPGLQERLVELVNTCRASGVTVIHSNFAEHSVQANPPAGVQRLLDDSKAISKDPHPDLTPKAGDVVLEPRETLSVFFDKTLEPTLKDRGIEHLVFAGSYVDLSVQSSARHSSENGFHTTVLEDCCGSMMEGGHAPSIQVTLPRLVHDVLIANQWFKIMKLNKARVDANEGVHG